MVSQKARILALTSLIGVMGMAQDSQASPKPTPSKETDDSGQSGIIYGEDHAYSVTAPKGWVLDNQVWADQGVFAVFYPLGSSVKGDWVAYTRVMDTNPKGLLACALEDMEGMKQQSPEYAWKRLPDIKTSDKNTAIVFSTSGDRLGNAEFLAYIQAPTHVIFISAVTKTPANRDQLRPPFESLVRSYTWIADKVMLPSGK